MANNVSCDGHVMVMDGHVTCNVSCDGHVASNVSCDGHGLAMCHVMVM